MNGDSCSGWPSQFGMPVAELVERMPAAELQRMAGVLAAGTMGRMA